VTVLARLRVLLGVRLGLVAVGKAEYWVLLAIVGGLLKSAEGWLLLLMGFVVRVKKVIVGLLIRRVIYHILLVWLVTDVLKSSKGGRHVLLLRGRFSHLFVGGIGRVKLLGVLIVVKFVLDLSENAIERGLEVRRDFLISELFNPHLLIYPDDGYWITMLLLQTKAVLLEGRVLFFLVLIHQWEIILALFVLANYLVIGAWLHLVGVLFRTGECLSAVHQVRVVVETLKLVLVRVVLEYVLY
jgi:hypothetical protein